MLVATPEALASLAAPWAKYYSHSKTAATIVTFLHVAPIVVGGGLAITLDRFTLRIRDDAAARGRHLEEIAFAHKSVVGGLVVATLSGIAMLLADLDTFLGSWIFWAKMLLIVALLANGFAMTRVETRLRTGATDLWGRLRVLSMASLVLWLVITFAGIALVNAG